MSATPGWRRRRNRASPATVATPRSFVPAGSFRANSSNLDQTYLISGIRLIGAVQDDRAQGHPPGPAIVAFDPNAFAPERQPGLDLSPVAATAGRREPDVGTRRDLHLVAHHARAYMARKVPLATGVMEEDHFPPAIVSTWAASRNWVG